MAPKLLLALIMSLVLAACGIESDTILPVHQSNKFLSMQPDKVLPVATTLMTRSDSCFDLSTTHWLYGVGTEQAVPEMAIQEAPEGRPLPRRYVIEATGDAMSEVLDRGLCTLNLVYHTGNHRLTGTLVTEFYYGEVLELTIDENARAKYDGRMMSLKVNVQTAQLRTSTQSFTLSSGEITLTLPVQPGGEIQPEIQMSSILCTQ